MSRTLRNIVAEAMRRERLGVARRPTYRQLAAIDDTACETLRQRADHLLRELEALGVTVALRDGAPSVSEQPPVEIYRGRLIGRDSFRIIRAGQGDDDWQVATVTGDQETINLTISEADILALGGRVLTGDASVMKVPSLTTILAVGTEVYRVNASRGEQ